MIHKIQYLRKLPVIGMPGGQSLPQDPNIGATPAPFVPSPVNPIIPVIPNTGTTVSIDPTVSNDPNIGFSPVPFTPGPVTPNGAPIVPNPIVPIIPTPVVPGGTPSTPVIQYPTPSNLVFHSITDLTATSNQPLVHSRDAAGNIILINDTSSNNQLLTIESVSYTVPNTVLNNVINTQFNYFKFPPRLSNIEVVDEISLSDAVDEVDLISTRFTPTLTSGRQGAIGRPPVLKAGRMIAEGVDDDLVGQEPTGYYGRDNEVFDILNMQTVLAGIPQLKLSKFIITPDLIEAGEDLFFRIRIKHNMGGNNNVIQTNPKIVPWAEPAPANGFNNFQARLTKITGPTGAFDIVMRTGTYPAGVYIEPTGVNLKSRLDVNISSIRANLNTYKSLLKRYDNMLVTIGDRTTTQQRAQLTSLKNSVAAAKLRYDVSRQTFKDTQITLAGKLNSFITNFPDTNRPIITERPAGTILDTYEMLYIVDINSARPYDEYSIETACGTYGNEIFKDSTYWQIVPISKIRNAFQ
jgi:hypothetical protein